jgi:hypothetical protein
MGAGIFRHSSYFVIEEVIVVVVGNIIVDLQRTLKTCVVCRIRLIFVAAEKAVARVVELVIGR